MLFVLLCRHYKEVPSRDFPRTAGPTNVGHPAVRRKRLSPFFKALAGLCLTMGVLGAFFNLSPIVGVIVAVVGLQRFLEFTATSPFLDELEGYSRLGLSGETTRLSDEWPGYATRAPEFAGTSNKKCALCNNAFRRLKMFRRRSLLPIHAGFPFPATDQPTQTTIDSGNFQVHDRCLNRYVTAMERVEPDSRHTL